MRTGFSGSSVVAAGLALLLAGCVSTSLPEMPNDPAYAPVVANEAAAEFHTAGAIRQARFGTSLFSDRRAMQVGDIITVRLVERTAARKDADTKIGKSSKVEIGDGAVLGKDAKLGSLSLGSSLSGERDFNGGAESSQSNSLNGSIAVSVTEVLPNGLLRVRGEKWLQLNRGSEYVRLTGLVRQEDLGPDNSVASTRLADARIGYSGTGELAASNRMGWLTRFFNSGWFPL